MVGGIDVKRPSPEIIGCPICGTRNFAIDDRCAQCGSVLEVVIWPRPPVRHIRLGSVMAVIAVVAVCLAPIRVSLGLSIFFAAYLLPATVRGVVVLERRRLDSRTTQAGDVFAVLISSFFVCGAIVTSAAIAFVATCFPIGAATFDVSGGPMGPGMISALVAGTIAGIATLYFVGRKLWPDRE